MGKRNIKLPTQSITFDRCSSTITSLPALTIWETHYRIWPSKAATILAGQRFSTFSLLPINGETLAEAICYASNIVRICNFSTLCHCKYTIWDKPRSEVSAEVSNCPQSEMHQKHLEFPTFSDNSVHNLQRTEKNKCVDWCSDMIRMYFLTVYVINLGMGCHNYNQLFHCAASVEHLGLDCKVEYTNVNLVIMPESHNIWVQYTEVTIITPSKAEFLFFLYYTVAGLGQIISSNVRSTVPQEKWYWTFQQGARTLNNGYYILKFENMQWWFQQCTNIYMVGLVV